MLVSLWLLASEEDGGVLTGDVVEDIAWRLHCEPSEVLAHLEELEGSGFVAINNKDSSSTLAGRKQGATLEERREEKEKSKRAPRNYSEDFQQVWAIHPRGPKGKADDEYRGAVGNGVTHDVIVSKLTDYVAAEVRLDDNPPFKGQHLHRWIRDERWEEEFEVRDTGYNPEVVFGGWFPPGLDKYDREGVDD